MANACAFVSVTDLPPLDGAGAGKLQVAAALAWVSIVPPWSGLFLRLILLARKSKGSVSIDRRARAATSDAAVQA